MIKLIKPICLSRLLQSIVIINICSTRYLMSESGSEGYAASKGGIYSLTHALALSLAQFHITVNSIAPGWIRQAPTPCVPCIVPGTARR